MNRKSENVYRKKLNSIGKTLRRGMMQKVGSEASAGKYLYQLPLLEMEETEPRLLLDVLEGLLPK